MSGLSDRLRIISSIGSKYFLDGGSLASNRRGSHRVRVWLGNGVGGVDRRMDRRMDGCTQLNQHPQVSMQVCRQLGRQGAAEDILCPGRGQVWSRCLAPQVVTGH